VYYLEKANAPLTKLEKHDVLVEENFNKYKKIDNRYKGLLTYLMADCPSVRGRIEKAEFEAVHLTNLVKRYNECIDPANKQTRAVGKPGSKLRAGLRAGMLSSNADFFTEGDVVRTYDFTPGVGYTGGVFMVFAYRNQVTVQPELLLTRKSASYRRTILANVSEERGELSQTYLQVPISIYYTLPTHKIRPFVSAGGFFGYAFSGQVTRASYNLRTGSEQSKPVLKLDKGDFGYRGGAGLLYQISPKRTVGLEYHYEQNMVNKSVVQERIRFTSHVLSLRVGL
jgi:opacity protein-like surface antigen